MLICCRSVLDGPGCRHGHTSHPQTTELAHKAWCPSGGVETQPHIRPGIPIRYGVGGGLSVLSSAVSLPAAEGCCSMPKWHNSMWWKDNWPACECTGWGQNNTVIFPIIIWYLSVFFTASGKVIHVFVLKAFTKQRGSFYDPVVCRLSTKTPRC